MPQLPLSQVTHPRFTVDQLELFEPGERLSSKDTRRPLSPGTSGGWVSLEGEGDVGCTGKIGFPSLCFFLALRSGEFDIHPA